MLQQTRVEAAIEPYRRFVAAFPSIRALAEADLDDVLAAWSGLGYYRRARLLHRGARVVVEKHEGRLPKRRDRLEAIPGIGAYTAGALLAIAFGQPEAAVDANVARVLGRVLGVRDSRGAGRTSVAALAGELTVSPRPGDVLEALMDLGSSHCTARIARCKSCPLAIGCAAGRAPDPLSFAAPKPRPRPRSVALCSVVVASKSRVLFVRRPDDETLLAGLWELPTVQAKASAQSCRELRGLVRSAIGVCPPLRGPVATVRHEIVGRKIEAAVYLAALDTGARTAASRGNSRVRLWPLERIDELGVSALPLKILDATRGSVRLRPRAVRGEARR